MRRVAAALVALVGLAAAADRATSPAFEREIAPTEGGLVAVTLDRHVYEAARPDLGDLRLSDERGREVPFTLDRGGPPVHPGPGEKARVAIERAWVPAGERAPRRELVLAPRWTRAEDPVSRETWLTLDLGARHQPFRAVALDVEDRRFFREVRVEARREAPSEEEGASALAWAEVGRGVVYRLEHEGRTHECLQIRAGGRERVLRLRVRNRDDRPLRIAGVHVVAPRERVLFEAASGSRYRLTYGAPGLAAPSYDLARTLEVEKGPGAVADLGPPVRRAVPAEPPLPWNERHPTLLWGGLIGVVAALGALTWQALRSL
jgi:hypothetical protein